MQTILRVLRDRRDHQSHLRRLRLGHIRTDRPRHLSFCINSWTEQLTYPFGQPCAPPRWTHTLPDDGDLLTCVNVYTGINSWIPDHSQCGLYELLNTIPATP